MSKEQHENFLMPAPVFDALRKAIIDYEKTIPSGNGFYDFLSIPLDNDLRQSIKMCRIGGVDRFLTAKINVRKD